MRKTHSCRWAVALALSSVLLLSELVIGELTARLVVDPKPAGLHVNADYVTFDGSVLGTIDLTVENASTNLLTIDATRSTFTTPDGEARQLSTVVGSDFTMALLPGESASGAISAHVAVQSGDQLKLSLVWTLGAVVGTATWTWEIADAAPTGPQPNAVPAASSEPTVSEGAGGVNVVGVIGLALGVLLVALLGWGLWSLVSLLW
jgi:hypothetical protein